VLSPSSSSVHLSSSLNFMSDLQYKCLLIDDDSDDRQIFSIALKKISAKVELSTAESGIKALEKLKADASYIPDFIFLDLNMPVMNGFECMRELKKLDHLRSAKIIIYTTSSDERDMEESKNMGAFRFVTKPFDINDLVTVLSEIFNIHGQTKA
jgi:CheY-like chemotaxis protein